MAYLGYIICISRADLKLPSGNSQAYLGQSQANLKKISGKCQYYISANLL